MAYYKEEMLWGADDSSVVIIVVEWGLGCVRGSDHQGRLFIVFA